MEAGAGGRVNKQTHKVIITQDTGRGELEGCRSPAERLRNHLSWPRSAPKYYNADKQRACSPPPAFLIPQCSFRMFIMDLSILSKQLKMHSTPSDIKITSNKGRRQNLASAIFPISNESFCKYLLQMSPVGISAHYCTKVCTQVENFQNII